MELTETRTHTEWLLQGADPTNLTDNEISRLGDHQRHITLIVIPFNRP